MPDNEDEIPIKVENLIFNIGNDYYEVFAADDGSQQIFFSYIFSVEEEKEVINKRRTLTRHGVSTTKKPRDSFMDLILEKTSEQWKSN